MTSLSSSSCVSSSSTLCKQDHVQNLSHKSNQSETGRKKRTFDIAFLTGQSEKNCESDISSGRQHDHEDEKESNNNSHHHILGALKRASSSFSSTTSPSFSGHTNISTSSPEPEFGRDESPYNLSSHNNHTHDYSSDTSIDVEMDVDVMTNGSLSDEEGTSTPLIPQSNHHHKNYPSLKKHHHQSNSSSSNQFHRSRVLLSLSQSHYNNHQNHHPGKTHHRHPTIANVVSRGNGGGGGNGHPSEVNGKTRGKSSGKNAYQKNTPVKEEIRFESKRTIDINHSQDSLKIKENLQFSTLIPANSLSGSGGHQPIHPHPHHPHHHHHQHPDFNEFILPPHLASTFALFPQFSPIGNMSKFPGLLPVLPMGQHSSLNATNSNHGHGHHGPNHQQGQPQQQQQHSPHSGLHFSSSSSSKVEKSEGTFSHHPHHNLNLSSSSSSGGPNHSPNNQKIRHFPDMYPGYPYPNLIIPPQFSPNNGNNHMSSSNQHSPNSVTTLLPPSLTALTLPAQNVCAKCNIGFRMTSDLVYHMRSHHKRDTFDPLKKQREEKLKCPVCHESFRERHHLTRHMTAHQDRVDEAAAAAALVAAAAAGGGINHAGTSSSGNISIGESNFGGPGSSNNTAGSSKLVVQ